MDLMDFFPSISASRVFGLFRSLGYLYAVTHLLSNLCTAVTTMEELEDATRALGERPNYNPIQEHAAIESDAWS